MLVEALLLIVGYYLFCSLSMYIYAVVKTWEFTGIWSFKIEDGYIGICEYPKWSLSWVELISNKIRGIK